MFGPVAGSFVTWLGARVFFGPGEEPFEANKAPAPGSGKTDITKARDGQPLELERLARPCDRELNLLERDVAVVVKTVLGSRFGGLVNSPSILKPILVGIGRFTGGTSF